MDWRRSPFNDPNGKLSFGRMMLFLAAVCMVAGAGAHDERVLETAKYLFVTFLGWEARKNHDVRTDRPPE
jgi:hypothetical protein